MGQFLTGDPGQFYIGANNAELRPEIERVADRPAEIFSSISEQRELRVAPSRALGFMVKPRGDKGHRAAMM